MRTNRRLGRAILWAAVASMGVRTSPAADPLATRWAGAVANFRGRLSDARAVHEVHRTKLAALPSAPDEPDVVAARAAAASRTKSEIEAADVGEAVLARSQMAVDTARADDRPAAVDTARADLQA